MGGSGRNVQRTAQRAGERKVSRAPPLALLHEKDWGKANSTLRLVQGSNLNHWQCLCCLEPGVQVGGATHSGLWLCTKIVPKT